jgi:putative intracellular protease/amidase
VTRSGPDQAGPEDPEGTEAISPGPQVAVLVYPGVNELELGLTLGLLAPLGLPGSAGTPDAAAFTVARSRGSVMCAGGLVCTPQLIFAAAPALAAVVIPGGLGAQKAGRDPALREFLAQARASRVPLGVVGSGLLLAGEAGLLAGRSVGCPDPLADTVWGYLPADLQQGRNVSDTPADLSALYSGPGGMNAAAVVLELVAHLWGTERARQAAERTGAART